GNRVRAEGIAKEQAEKKRSRHIDDERADGEVRADALLHERGEREASHTANSASERDVPPDHGAWCGIERAHSGAVEPRPLACWRWSRSTRVTCHREGCNLTDSLIRVVRRCGVLSCAQRSSPSPPSWLFRS